MNVLLESFIGLLPRSVSSKRAKWIKEVWGAGKRMSWKYLWAQSEGAFMNHNRIFHVVSMSKTFSWRHRRKSMLRSCVNKLDLSEVNLKIIKGTNECRRRRKKLHLSIGSGIWSRWDVKLLKAISHPPRNTGWWIKHIRTGSDTHC